jgi:hypothetical protein
VGGPRAQGLNQQHRAGSPVPSVALTRLHCHPHPSGRSTIPVQTTGSGQGMGEPARRRSATIRKHRPGRGQMMFPTNESAVRSGGTSVTAGTSYSAPRRGPRCGAALEDARSAPALVLQEASPLEESLVAFPACLCPATACSAALPWNEASPTGISAPSLHFELGAFRTGTANATSGSPSSGL